MALHHLFALHATPYKVLHDNADKHCQWSDQTILYYVLYHANNHMHVHSVLPGQNQINTLEQCHVDCVSNYYYFIKFYC